MAFDKENFSQLLARAKGDRSINSFGNLAKVDPGYISRLLRQKIETPPGPGVIKKLAEHALPGVTYEDLMAAAGYIHEHPGKGVYSVKGSLEQKVAEALQKPLAEFLPLKSIPMVNPSIRDFDGLQTGDIVDYINVPRELEADFAITVKDNAMIDAGIFPGDVAVCRKTARALPGEMVIARLESGNAGIRYLLVGDCGFRLKAANDSVPEQKIKSTDIIGTVLMIQKKALRYEQYESLRQKDVGDEVIAEDFLLEKLAESSGLPLDKLRKALNSIKEKQTG